MDAEPVSFGGVLHGNRPTAVDLYQSIDLSSRIDGASPHALVKLLYAELLLTLDVMRRALETGDCGRVTRQFERASTILHRLEAGLDFARGGDLASTLGGIYRQMRKRLIDGSGGDIAAVAEVRDGVFNLAEAWARITL